MRLGQDNLIHDNKPAARSVGIYWPIDGRCQYHRLGTRQIQQEVSFPTVVSAM